MSAPSATARQSPSGRRLLNGFPTKVTFARDPDVSFWETNVTPPGMDGGEKIDTTTMFNALYRTAAPRELREFTNGSITAAYDPAVLSQIVELINEPTVVTVRHPDGSTEAHYGYLKSFTPGERSRDEDMPTATIEFVITATDPSDHSESGPTVTSVSGT